MVEYQLIVCLLDVIINCLCKFFEVPSVYWFLLSVSGSTCFWCQVSYTISMSISIKKFYISFIHNCVRGPSVSFWPTVHYSRRELDNAILVLWFIFAMFSFNTSFRNAIAKTFSLIVKTFVSYWANFTYFPTKPSAFII